MTQEEMIRYAQEEGFAAVAVTDTRSIVFDPAFRVYCEENLCGQYGINASCPPDCGSPEEMKQRILGYKNALVLQSIWQIGDYADGPAIRQAKMGHNNAQLRLAQRLRQGGHPGLLVGASGCALCSPCMKSQGLPCKYPQLRYSCMSAYCIFVKKLADQCRMEYACGEGLLALFGMYVFDPKQ